VPNTESGDISDKRFVLKGKALAASGLVEVDTPAAMGILNVTPDSFSDGGIYSRADEAARRTERMIREGAAIVDIGGESTRPGSEPVSGQEELDRVIPVIGKVVRTFPSTMFSIDTTKYEVARRALDYGVQMINDVSGLQKEPRLADLAAEYEAILVIMHSRGTPKVMQHSPQYGDVIGEIAGFLKKQAEMAGKRGVEQVVIDPGIGFGKTVNHNLQIIAQFNTFKALRYPVLIGASRKSVIGKVLADDSGERPVDQRLAGTLALHYHALMQGADILRVHDVREAVDGINIYRSVRNIR